MMQAEICRAVCEWLERPRPHACAAGRCALLARGGGPLVGGRAALHGEGDLDGQRFDQVREVITKGQVPAPLYTRIPV